MGGLHRVVKLQIASMEDGLKISEQKYLWLVIYLTCVIALMDEWIRE